ncbi:MAG: trigger factor [Bacteroidaceae bacterium]|jgi:trigger factor|nr:trigger factor [Bacteroidaceae bacterium]MBR0182993.1 trigger factor [Bacteroidaceae bacterium]
MKISFEKTDKINGLLTITLAKADYEANVEKTLKDYRRKASLPGFRPGQAPMSILKKRFGQEVQAEELNKMLGTELYKYIREEKIDILGEPMPSDKQGEISLDADEQTFVFDIALAPEMDAKISNKDTIEYYNIEVDDAMVDNQVKMYASRAGGYQKVDEYQPKDMVKGILTELGKTGKPKRGGIEVEGATMLPDYMKDEDEKAKFNGMKAGDVITFNPSKAYNSDVELSSLLKITKEEAAAVTGDFQFQVSEITRYEPHALDQELFDMALGKDKVKSEEEFRAAIRENLSEQFKTDSEFRFVIDLKKYLVKRIGNVEFPEAMLKRIMQKNNPDKDAEFIEKNFQPSIEELKWHLIKEQLCDQLEIKVEQPDVLETAKEVTRMQFAQYGMTNIPEDALNNYANEMLKNKQQAEGLVTRTVERKLGVAAKSVVKISEKTVTLDEFNKAFQEA